MHSATFEHDFVVFMMSYENHWTCAANKRYFFFFLDSTSMKESGSSLKLVGSYLSPSLIASSGEQETVSGQFGDLCCLLSRNQPESTRPRT